jgi:uncharacterized protein
MTLHGEDERVYNSILRDLAQSRQALGMKRFVQHGSVSTYDHAENVARLSYIIYKRLRLRADLRALLRGAFLHDFFLYDWHKKREGERLHGFAHPEIAAHNAQKFFGIGDKERHIILCHMWPLTITRLPRCREAWVVCIADKLCSIMETVAMRRR